MATVRRAAAALGWAGVPVQVRFGGEDAWVIAGLTDAVWHEFAQGGRSTRVEVSSVGVSAVRIIGAIVTGPASSKVAVRASVFAGYSPRSVLVPDGPGVLEVQVAAAMLEQGVVVASGGGVRLLSPPGPMQPGAVAAAEAAQRRLCERVHANLAAAGASLEFL